MDKINVNINLKRSKSGPLVGIIFLTLILPLPLFGYFKTATSPDQATNYFFDFLMITWFMILVVFILISLVMIIKNRGIEGNRIIIYSDTLILPLNHWISKPWKTKKEIMIRKSQIKSVSVNNQMDRFSFIELRIETNSYCFFVLSKWMEENEFKDILKELKIEMQNKQ